ncbi:MAG: Hint domain-containing protein [Pseudomonadota bacterium]
MSVSTAPSQSVPVLRNSAFRVTNGVNRGDPVMIAEELLHDDIYGLVEDDTQHRLAIAYDRVRDGFVIAEDTEIGTPGADLAVDCAITVMSTDSSTCEILVLVEVDNNELAEIYLVPLAQLHPKMDYTLVGIDQTAGAKRMSELACVSFTRSTMITMASGAQKPIEELRIGDRVLTRDDGPQQIRWIGQSTMRAVGSFAPICIKAGTLNNAGDLIVSPDHRLFIYQRDDALGAGRSEVLVKARLLVNGTSVVQQDGGFVDYFQLLFDSHQIIYAEGIAAESFLIDPHTRPALPEKLETALNQVIPSHSDSTHREFEVAESLVSGDAAETLRRASTR